MKPFEWGDGEALVRLAYETYANKMIDNSGSKRTAVPWEDLPGPIRSMWLQAAGMTAILYASREVPKSS